MGPGGPTDAERAARHGGLPAGTRASEAHSYVHDTPHRGRGGGCGASRPSGCAPRATPRSSRGVWRVTPLWVCTTRHTSVVEGGVARHAHLGVHHTPRLGPGGGC